ncbi:hypothetical protein [Sodalis glossinidius]|uniref:hypothetical protein n=1 Tax=Sodalis glossinidius TaxID=63612 RepID=UPI001305243C|nr:hypothetical protein [Sodalis glossinidius]
MNEKTDAVAIMRVVIIELPQDYQVRFAIIINVYPITAWNQRNRRQIGACRAD